MLIQIYSGFCFRKLAGQETEPRDGESVPAKEGKNNKDALTDVLTKLINQGNTQRVTSFKQWFGMGLGNTVSDVNIDTFLSNNYINIFKFN